MHLAHLAKTPPLSSIPPPTPYPLRPRLPIDLPPPPTSSPLRPPLPSDLLSPPTSSPLRPPLPSDQPLEPGGHPLRLKPTCAPWPCTFLGPRARLGPALSPFHLPLPPSNTSPSPSAIPPATDIWWTQGPALPIKAPFTHHLHFPSRHRSHTTCTSHQGTVHTPHALPHQGTVHTPPALPHQDTVHTPPALPHQDTAPTPPALPHQNTVPTPPALLPVHTPFPPLPLHPPPSHCHLVDAHAFPIQTPCLHYPPHIPLLTPHLPHPPILLPPSHWHLVDSEAFPIETPSFHHLHLPFSRFFSPLFFPSSFSFSPSFLPSCSLLLSSFPLIPSSPLPTSHWHLVDAEAFPIETPSFPRLWKGAHSPHERYLLADMGHVVG
ncbi:unnamed protein product [Closterium sp. NIES-53]